MTKECGKLISQISSDYIRQTEIFKNMHTHAQMQTRCIISLRENIYDEILEVFMCVLYTLHTREKYLAIQHGKEKTGLGLVATIFY